MNKLIIITAVFFTAVFSVFGQKTSGQVSYDVFVTTDDPQAQSYVSNMEGSILELYFHEGKIKSELFMGELITTTTVSEKDEDTVLVLVDGMMGQIAMKTTENDMSDEQKLAMSKRDVELVDESKEIMGYECKKAIVTGADDKESVIWYTTEIVPSYRGGQYMYEDIPGVPLEINSSWGKMDLKMVAFEYKKKIKKPEKVFSKEVPSGFVLRTAEEMKQMRRGR